MSDSARTRVRRVYLARAFAISDECVPREIDATRTGFLMINERRSSLPVAVAAPRCRCFAHSGNFGLADSGGQERETLTPRIGLETECAASRRAMPACDWTAGRVFYQESLSTRRASREMTREKTNAEFVREKIQLDSTRKVFAENEGILFELFSVQYLFS